MEGGKMNINYNDKTDLLYIQLDDKDQENEKLLGIEILDSSKHVNLERLFPVEYKISKTAS
jgi:uncharacterized protein YuzE